MNRLLYQLSYAAMWSKDFGTAEISFIIVSEQAVIVKTFFRFFDGIFGNTSSEVKIHGFSQEMSAFLHRRRRLCGAGAALAGVQPYQHVRGGRGVLLLIGQLGLVQPVLPWPLRAVIGAGIITMVELAAGLLVNQHYQIWDYRGRPGNFLGQICPAFTLLWIPVALMAMGLYRWLDWRLDRMLGV